LPVTLFEGTDMTAKIRLHGVPLSGHTHKVELFLRLLGLEFEYVNAPRETWSSEAFTRLNPLRQIPVLEDGDLVLADSNAILVYLAKRYDAEGGWLPADAVGAAQVQRWLSISAGEIRFGPATARVIKLMGRPGDLEAAQAIARTLLGVMEQRLTAADWLATDRITLADIACYPYLACAPEGGVDLSPYPAVRAWLARVEAQPGVKPMPSAVAA
jgi:glutathione S-transferase